MQQIEEVFKKNKTELFMCQECMLYAFWYNKKTQPMLSIPHIRRYHITSIKP